VSEVSDAFLVKARESLAGATSELANGRHNNAANRSYYACFQAAIAALDVAGVRPPGGRNDWGHDFVQAQFAGLLIGRRKLYPVELRDTLSQTLRVRAQADYNIATVSQTQASRSLTRARALVDAVAARVEMGG
jgi:uncharacterized protein (UPF0332 family)